MTLSCFAKSEQALATSGGISPSFSLLFPLCISFFLFPSSWPPLKPRSNWNRIHSQSWNQTISWLSLSRPWLKSQRISKSLTPLSSTRQQPITKSAANSINYCFKFGHIDFPLKTVTEGSHCEQEGDSKPSVSSTAEWHAPKSLLYPTGKVDELGTPRAGRRGCGR